jgi:hypothetical protein
MSIRERASAAEALAKAAARPLENRTPAILFLILGNVTQAMLAATLLRSLGYRPPGFDTP